MKPITIVVVIASLCVVAFVIGAQRHKVTVIPAKPATGAATPL